VSLINVAGLIAGGILAMAAAFTIANVIRLTMMLYRERSTSCGWSARPSGSSAAVSRGGHPARHARRPPRRRPALRLVLRRRHFLAPSASLLWGFLFVGFLPWQKLAALVGGGMLAGWIGSWLSVRESSEE